MGCNDHVCLTLSRIIPFSTTMLYGRLTARALRFNLLATVTWDPVASAAERTAHDRRLDLAYAERMQGACCVCMLRLLMQAGAELAAESFEVLCRSLLNLHAHSQPIPLGQQDQGIKAEVIDAAPQQVVQPRLRYPRPARGLGLGHAPPSHGLPDRRHQLRMQPHVGRLRRAVLQSVPHARKHLSRNAVRSSLPDRVAASCHAGSPRLDGAVGSGTGAT